MRTHLSRTGTVALEDLIVISVVAVLGTAALGSLGKAMGDDVSGDVGGRSTVASAPSAMAVSRQAGAASVVGEALEAARATLSAAEKAGLRRSPIGQTLQLSSHAEWRYATEFFMGRRLSEGRALGERITRPFEAFLGSADRKDARRLRPTVLEDLRTSETAPAGAVGASVTDERLSRLVEDPILDILAKYGGAVVRSDEASEVAYAFEGRQLVLYENHPQFSKVKGESDGLIQQIYERYALHLMEEAGVPAASAYKLVDWLHATEALRAKSLRRVTLDAEGTSLVSKDAARRTHVDIHKRHLATLMADTSRTYDEGMLARLRADIAEGADLLPNLEAQLRGLEAASDKLGHVIKALAAAEWDASEAFRLARLGVGAPVRTTEAVTARMLAAAEEGDAVRAALGAKSTTRTAPRTPRATPKAEEAKAASPSAKAADFLARLNAEGFGAD